jgi:hypothetical protein
LKPYKIPEYLKVEVENQINTLLRDGFIVPSNSPMISPVICVVKQDKFNTKVRQIRLVCDFRYLNKFTVSDPFPVPDQDEVINKLASFKYISIFDAKSGYWQTSVKPSCRWLLGFATHHGLWEWTRTPFGAKNSGSTFIRAIQRVLDPIRDITSSYVDDMGVGSHTWEEHLLNLKRYFDVLVSNGITLNLDKCEFVKSRVKFLGQVVGSGTREADPEKIKAIQCIPRPTTLKDLKSFLGVVTYHCAYIPQFAAVAKPLTDLTSTASKFKPLSWCDQHENSFNSLKAMLCNITALTVPRSGGLFILRTDASNWAISGCLYQRPDDNPNNVVVTGDDEKPIFFYSQKLTRSQAHWSTIEKEAFAVIASLRKFHHIVFGSQIVIYCDHNPLSYLVDNTTHSAKLTRWYLALQEYNIVFRYAKAKNNLVADFFSRCS